MSEPAEGGQAGVAQYPTSPPYAPVAAPPTVGDGSPPPPPWWPPEHSPQGEKPEPPKDSRGKVAAGLFAVVLILAAALGVTVGAALRQPSSGTSSPASTATTAPSGTAQLPSASPSAPSNGAAALTPDAIAAQVNPAVVDIYTTLSDGSQAAGTGMVLTSSGLVLTNNHVIADATAFRLQINGRGPVLSAAVVGYDVTNDVALLQLKDVSGLSTVTVADSSSVATGDTVVAIGNALGKGGPPSVTSGTVTALGQTITVSDSNGDPQTLNDLIEVNARLLPGDSGGPLLNDTGKVIGMNTAASAMNRRSPSDGYAIPINTALTIVSKIQAGQSSDTIHVGDRALLGVQLAPNVSSASVAAVQPSGPAASAGLASGDVITTVGQTTIRSAAELRRALEKLHPGDTVSIGWVDSSGARHVADVRLAAGPPA